MVDFGVDFGMYFGVCFGWILVGCVVALFFDCGGFSDFFGCLSTIAVDFGVGFLCRIFWRQMLFSIEFAR